MQKSQISKRLKKILYIFGGLILASGIFFSSSQVSQAAIEITTSSPLPKGTVGQDYKLQLQAQSTGFATKNYTWKALGWDEGRLLGAPSIAVCGLNVQKNLPSSGLYLGENGVIYGKPTTSGDFGFQAWVNSGFAKKDFCLHIDPASAAASQNSQLAPQPGGMAPQAEGLGVTSASERCKDIPQPYNIKNPKFYTANDEAGNSHKIAYDGLVPCGKCVIKDPSSATGGITQGGSLVYTSCQFCHFKIMFKGIVDWVVGVLVPIVAILMLTVGGLMFFFAGNSPSLLQQGKDIIKKVVWGLIIIFSAYLIVNVLMSFLGLAQFTGSGFDPRKWFNFTCDVKI